MSITQLSATDCSIYLLTDRKNEHLAKPMTLKPEISLTNTKTDFSLYLKLHYLWQESGLNNITGPP